MFILEIIYTYTSKYSLRLHLIYISAGSSTISKTSNKTGGGTIYTAMQSEYNKLNNTISEISERIEALPQGYLVCTKNKKYYKWYKKNNSVFLYIKKQDKKLAEQLALKNYFTALKSDLQHEKDAIEKYLDYHKINSEAQNILEHPEYNKLICEYLSSKQEKISAWENDEYVSNPAYPEKLIHLSPSGNKLRSKSEAVIDMLLFFNKIPFRYESELILDDLKVYPDFTIRHPKTGEYYYWEHFGMMDNKQYVRNAFSKLQLYALHNIMPSINLITTFETIDKPLSNDLVAKIIKYYFL